jgi:hypothetical protein
MYKARKLLAKFLSLVLVLSAILSFNITVQAEELTKGPILIFQFEGSLNSSGGYDILANPVGNITYVDGVFGKAAKFDGQSYIEISNIKDDLDALKDGYSFSAWIYKDEIRPLREQPILQKIGGSEDEAPSFVFADRDYEPYVQVYTEDENFDQVFAPKVEMQKWTFLAVTYDKNYVKFYEDGVLKTSKQIKGTIPTSTSKLLIGYDEYDGGSFFKGMMDDIKIYDGIFTSQQIQTEYQEGIKALNLKNPNVIDALVAYYKFDNDVKDYSGFNNNGAIVGNISYVNGVSGKAAKFDGSSYIEINDSDYIDLTKGYTFNLWINKEDIGAKREQPLLMKQGSSIDIEQASYILSDRDFEPYVQVHTVESNFDEVYTDNQFDKNKWIMLTASYDGKNVKFYKNGTLISNKAWAGEIPGSSGKLILGFNEYDGGSFFKGSIDELKIYNCILVPERIKMIYNSTAAAPSTPPVSTVSNAPSSWAVAEINKAKELNLTTDKVLSNYQANITREEFCELAVKLYEALSGKPAEPVTSNPFTDTTNQEILKAYNLKIVNGVSADKFAPNNSVTRQEICVMIIRTLQAAKPGFAMATNDDLTFADEKDIAPWAKTAIRSLNTNGIMKGVGTTAISITPTGNTTREQAIAMVKRTFEGFSKYIWVTKPEGGGEWKLNN